MSKERLYKRFLGMGIAFIKLSFAAWLDEEMAKEKLKEVRFFTMLEKIVEQGKPQYTDEVTFHGKTLKFKARLEQALTEQDKATKKRIQEALKGNVGTYKK